MITKQFEIGKKYFVKTDHWGGTNFKGLVKDIEGRFVWFEDLDNPNNDYFVVSSLFINDFHMI